MTYFKIHFLNERVMGVMKHGTKLCPLSEKIQTATVRLSMAHHALASHMVTAQ